RIAVFMQDSLTESACLRKWRRFQAGGIIHFPTHNFFLNSLTFAGISSNSGLKSRNCCSHAAFHGFILTFERFACRRFSGIHILC
ncbi:MAG: hypothetical protein E6230_00005, partial [Paenibacillus dendritiformis]|nr:hypothetical protein [Paenibacillus dendritiformis]